jgi:hypothetical protein
VDQLRPIVVTLLVILTLAAGRGLAFAQQSSAPTTTKDRPLLLLSAEYGTPLRWAGGAGVLIPRGRPVRMDGGTSGTRAGIEIAASAGQGGARVTAGPALIANEGGAMIVGLDFRGTLARTRARPRGATGDSTYIGAEAGLAISVVRFSAGVAHRVAGPAGSKGTTFTWTVGLQIPLGW